MKTNTFDYIIVGAGSAGAVLANRLTADAQKTALVLEAGRESHLWSNIPVGFAKLIDNPSVNWLYESEPDEGTHNRQIPVPRGKLLGGSSAINGMVFVRGQAQDYDVWAQLGNRGWSYQDVLPIFKEMESYNGDGDPEFRGEDGPLKISDTVDREPLYDSIIKAAEGFGLQYTPDYNGARQDGIGLTQTTIHRGRRMSTAHCYLQPVRKRRNLEIQTRACVEALTIKDKKCVGVRYKVGRETRAAKVNREVILAAGTINSPQLLELSGIGQPEILRKNGITLVHSLNGVGENLRDHFAPRFRWSIPRKLGLTYNDRGHGVKLIWESLKFAAHRRGLIGMSSGPLRAFIRTREGLDSPDAMIAWMPFLMGPNFSLSKNSGVSAVAHILRSESKGSVHIKSGLISNPPSIKFNFLSTQLDREVTIEAARVLRKIMNSPALNNIIEKELDPGIDIQSDAEILTWIRKTGETCYHPVGTCKMGNDMMAVVDDQLKVHGIENLRVADASIMPTLTSGNTNGPSIMIGEKASRMILASE